MLWGEAISHVVWVKNRSATRALDGKTPYEMLCGEKPNIANVPEWGTRCWVHNDSGSKLDARAREGHWVGYDPESTSAHRIYLPDRRIVAVERNVTFQRRDGVAIGRIGVTSEGVNEDTARLNEGRQPVARDAQPAKTHIPALPPAPDPPHDHLGKSFEIPAPQNELRHSN